MTSTETLNGAVVVDKPAGCTSHDVVNRIRRFAGTRRIGHLGTLDPDATGVLPLLVGKATRLAQFFGRADKKYEGVVAFGYSTTTWDAAGTPTSEPVTFSLDRQQLEASLDTFRGPIQQVPPPVSAKKVNGVPAYKLARKKQPVDLPACDVTIYTLEILDIQGNEASLRIHCSAGTYVRSIAHELGQLFGCGAHLKRLRRTAAGQFSLEHAHTLDELQVYSEEGRFEEALVPGRDLLPEMPMQIVEDPVVISIRHGREFRVSPFSPAANAPLIRAVSEQGELVGVGKIQMPALYRPVVVL